MKRHLFALLLLTGAFFASKLNVFAQGETLANATVHEARIAVVLPFRSQLSEGQKSIEFYRGLLMAANTLKAKGYSAQFSAFDEGQPESDLSQTLKDAAENADLIVGVTYRDHMITAAKFGAENGIPVAFPLANYIPQDLISNQFSCFLTADNSLMTKKVAELLIGRYLKGNVIYLQSNLPQAAVQTSELTAQLYSKGYKLKTLDAGWVESMLDKAMNSKRQNIIVTDSNDPNAVRRLLTRIKEFSTTHPKYNITVVGTSAWMEFYDKMKDNLAGLDVLLPTTWFQNSASSKIAELNSTYQQEFNTTPSEGAPSTYLIGYDFGLYALAGLSHFGRDFILHPNNVPQVIYDVQLQQTESCQCWTNGGIRMLHCKADGTLEMIGFKRNN